MTTTPNEGFRIIQDGTLDWGSEINKNTTLIDEVFGEIEQEIADLRSASGDLPTALASAIAGNLLRNNIFAVGVVTDTNRSRDWTPEFENGASGNVTRDSNTTLTGSHSQRIEVTQANTVDQIRPYPGLNMLDPETEDPLPATDPRQLMNSFGLIRQTVTIKPNTTYTLSCYGKAEIPNISASGGSDINNHWKIGIVFRSNSGATLHSHFSTPQINRTNQVDTDSFARTQLNFTSPNIGAVIAEVWLVCEGTTPSSIGSAWFDGVQLEQAAQATALQTVTTDNGSLAVDGDLTVGGNLILQQDQLNFQSDEVTFTGNVQLGDNPDEDVLDVLAAANFYGTVDIARSTSIGTDPTSHLLEVRTLTTTFYDNQDPLNKQGGNVVVQGNLKVDGNLTLGNDSQDAIIIEGLDVIIDAELKIEGNSLVEGTFEATRGVILGSNSLNDGLNVNMSDLGSTFNGDVRFNDDFYVKGSTVLGDNPLEDRTTINGFLEAANGASIDGSLSVGGPTSFNIGNTVGDTFTVSARDLVFNAETAEWNINDLIFGGSLNVGTDSQDSLIVNAGTIQLGFEDSSSSNTLDIYARTEIHEYLKAHKSVDILENLSVNGDIFNFGSRQGSPSKFITAQTTDILDKDGQPVLDGTISLGDQSAIISTGSGDRFAATLNIFAGDVKLGTGAGKSDLQINGSLETTNNTKLGSNIETDLFELNAFSADLNIGDGGIKVAGGFQNNTYDLDVINHGGITIDNNGNLAMDGKLTVKGPFDPVNIIIETLAPEDTPNALEVFAPLDNDGYTVRTKTFGVSTEGVLTTAESISVDSGFVSSINENNTSFGSLQKTLTTFDVFSASTNISGNLTLGGNISTGGITSSGNISASGDISGEDLILSGNIEAAGTSFTFGQEPDTTTSFNVKAGQISLGVANDRIGDVVIGKSATIGESLSVGSPDTLDIGTTSVYAKSFDVEVASDQEGIINETLGQIAQNLYPKTTGFRVGGGFINKQYDADEIDHGGVTIDGYGNIYADGDIFTKGDISYNNLILTTPLGGNADNPVLTVINDAEGNSERTVTIDGYGHVFTHDHFETNRGVEIISSNVDENPFGKFFTTGLTTLTEPSTEDREGAQSREIFRIDAIDSDITYDTYSYGQVAYKDDAQTSFSIDNFGNLITNGYLVTDNPSYSNVATYSVTVGDSLTSFGDFNSYIEKSSSANRVEAGQNPIVEAINYLTNLSLPGTIFLKRGRYSIPTSGLTIPENITIIGEGSATSLDGTPVIGGGGLIGEIPYGKYNGVGVSLSSGASLQNLVLTNVNVGFEILEGSSDCKVSGIDLVDVNVAASVKGDFNTINQCSMRITSSTLLAVQPQGFNVEGDNNIITECTVVGNSTNSIANEFVNTGLSNNFDNNIPSTVDLNKKLELDVDSNAAKIMDIIFTNNALVTSGTIQNDGTSLIFSNLEVVTTNRKFGITSGQVALADLNDGDIVFIDSSTSSLTQQPLIYNSINPTGFEFILAYYVDGVVYTREGGVLNFNSTRSVIGGRRQYKSSLEETLNSNSYTIDLSSSPIIALDTNGVSGTLTLTSDIAKEEAGSTTEVAIVTNSSQQISWPSSWTWTTSVPTTISSPKVITVKVYSFGTFAKQN